MSRCAELKFGNIAVTAVKSGEVVLGSEDKWYRPLKGM